MARAWALRILACLAAATVLLTGCSHKQEPSSSAPTTTSAKPSPTLPPLGPADFPVPAEARQKTEAGVVAFANYYIELSNRLLKSFDSGPLRSLSRNCADCNQLADGYDAARSAGYTCEGGRLSVSSTGTTVLTGDHGEVSWSLHQEAITVRDRTGAVVPSMTSGAFDLSGGIGLNWDPQLKGWLVTQLAADRVAQ